MNRAPIIMAAPAAHRYGPMARAATIVMAGLDPIGAKIA
jgi:hypothetical protein